MKLNHTLTAIILLSSFASPVAAYTVEDAVIAHNKGQYETALRLFHPLAGQGNARAQFYLGFMYQNGRGVKIDNHEAIVWYRKAADQGDVEAQFNLGTVYRYGTQTGQNVQDYVRAYVFFSLAAARGNQGAVISRDEVKRFMTPAQIAKAQKLAREWKPTTRPPR